jgi:predicted phosphodiesterase
MSTESPHSNSLEAVAGLVEKQDRPSLFGRVGRFFGKTSKGELIEPAEPVALTGTVRIAWQDKPFALTLGVSRLEFHPDLTITGKRKDGSREWIIHSGEDFYTSVPRFIRVRPGQELVLGRRDELQCDIFGFNSSVANRHVRVCNKRGELSLQPLDDERITNIEAISSARSVWRTRKANLQRLCDVIGHPLKPYDDEEALDVITRVNAIMAKEAYRERDDDGAPGGIIQFPRSKTTIVLGDVHTRIDNVLRILTEGGTLAALEDGSACLVFLGDLVHSEERGEIEEMDSSLFILDVFCMLKLRFPKNVFYVHGNHDSFSPEVCKAGVPQGILLRRFLKKRRGKAYVQEVDKLFDGLAYIVAGNDFAACHGGPVRSRVIHSTLVNLKRYPGIQHELVWNRVRRDTRPNGYGKGSVKRFRQTLGIAKHAPVIVGHTPLSFDETVWFNIMGITGHHIVYTAHTDRAAAMVLHDKKMVALEYIPENSLAMLNAALDEPDLEEAEEE